jgi:hypothetical protein
MPLRKPSMVSVPSQFLRRPRSSRLIVSARAQRRTVAPLSLTDGHRKPTPRPDEPSAVPPDANGSRDETAACGDPFKVGLVQRPRQNELEIESGSFLKASVHEEPEAKPVRRQLIPQDDSSRKHCLRTLWRRP